MTTTLNASTAGAGGFIATSDNSGILALQTAGTTAITVDASQIVSYTNNLGTVAGYPAYQCRAWVNFNGSGTVAIRASGNVSSITDNGVGDYTVNFTNAMPDANFSVGGSYNTGNSIPSRGTTSIGLNTTATGSVRVWTGYGSTIVSNGALEDPSTVCVNVFR